jgi:hypothetical protein
LAAGILLVISPESAMAAGGRDIASAPGVAYDQLMMGGGQQQEFWRLPVTAGDRLTLRYEKSPGGRYQYVYIFDPSVDDYRLRDAQPVHTERAEEGKSEFIWTAPFTGSAVLLICQKGDYYLFCGQHEQYTGVTASAFSFVGSLEHQTAVLLRSIPRLVRSRTQRIRLGARVQSPAGEPRGSCAVDRVGGGRARELTITPVVGGACSALVRTGRYGRTRFRVRFLPEDGWLASDATSRTVTTRRSSR